MKKQVRTAVIMTSSGWGGLELNTLKLIDGIRPELERLTVIAQENTHFAREAVNNGYDVMQLRNTRRYFDFANARKLARYLEENQVDCLLSIYRPDLDLIAWTKRICKRPFKVIHQQQMQIGVAKKGWLQRHRYRSVDAWIAPLPWLKQEVLEKTVVPANKIHIIPLGVRTDQFLKRNYSREEARQLLGCATEAELIGVIGRIDAKKGQLLLIQAVERLRKQGGTMELLIVGEPTVNDPKGELYYREIQEYIALHNLEEVVHFSGFTKDVARFYNAIDTFVMSSQGETYGMVTLEALLSGLPVIGTRSGGTPELLGNGTRGELYDFLDVASFVEAYQRLQQRLGSGELDTETIRQEIASQFDFSVEVRGILELINQ